MRKGEGVKLNACSDAKQIPSQVAFFSFGSLGLVIVSNHALNFPKHRMKLPITKRTFKRSASKSIEKRDKN